jgi:uncharacterized damage-inducible protein DinB
MRRLWVSCACAAVIAIAAPALAQESARNRDKRPRTSRFADVTRAAWYSINDVILASAARMPEEHYGFQPTKDVRTFAQILAHVAADRYTTCGPTVGRRAPTLGYDKLQDKKEISEILRDSAAVCDMAYGLLSDENASFRYRAFNGEYTRFALLVSNITHNSEHYGNLVTYMRLKGVVPPSTAGVR